MVCTSEGVGRREREIIQNQQLDQSHDQSIIETTNFVIISIEFREQWNAEKKNKIVAAFDMGLVEWCNLHRDSYFFYSFLRITAKMAPFWVLVIDQN